MEKDPKTIPAKNVDEYMQALPEPVRTLLAEVRRSIKTAAPHAEEVISYRIPTYKYLGPLVHFAAFENHCSLIVVSKSIIEIFKRDFFLTKHPERRFVFRLRNPFRLLL